MTRSAPVLCIVLVCTLSFSIFGCDYLVEDNLIPDVELRYKIRSELYIRSEIRSDHPPITEADMLKLTELDASHGGFWDVAAKAKPISDLTGLEYAENLVVLNLRGNRIRDVSPLEELENLKELNLSSNELINIRMLTGLENLEELDLSSNGIMDISPLAGLENLQELDLRYNPLSIDSKKRIIPIIGANGTEVLY